MRIAIETQQCLFVILCLTSKLSLTWIVLGNFPKMKNKGLMIIWEQSLDWYFWILFVSATMTIQQLKGIIQRSLKVQNVKQKLSYLDEKVIGVHILYDYYCLSHNYNYWAYIELFSLLEFPWNWAWW